MSAVRRNHAVPKRGSTSRPPSARRQKSTGTPRKEAAPARRRTARGAASQRRVVLIDWNVAAAQEGVEQLRQAGYVPQLLVPRDFTSFRELADAAPDAIVIDLARRPAAGRDAGALARQRLGTRKVPLVLVSGTPEKVARARALLPDATFSTWRRIGAALRRARARPLRQPIVRDSMAAYSGTPLPQKAGHPGRYPSRPPGRAGGVRDDLGEAAARRAAPEAGPGHSHVDPALCAFPRRAGAPLSGSRPRSRRGGQHLDSLAQENVRSGHGPGGEGGVPSVLRTASWTSRSPPSTPPGPDYASRAAVRARPRSAPGMRPSLKRAAVCRRPGSRARAPGSRRGAPRSSACPRT